MNSKKKLSSLFFLINRINPILEKHEVKRAALFGSASRGEMRKDSDIDLLVEFKGRKSLLDLVRLRFVLEEKLKRPVDVTTFNSLHPYLKNQVQKEMISIL
ncbi:MAG: nucleotidyltransferase family protein [Candidatus Magasanikbacteria bacterium]|nr:nucleotidyltransferase family protein [Candidatus Magasanikbacteria bacterium]